jgi:hypothetical protein
VLPAARRVLRAGEGLQEAGEEQGKWGSVSLPLHLPSALEDSGADQAFLRHTGDASKAIEASGGEEDDEFDQLASDLEDAASKDDRPSKKKKRTSTSKKGGSGTRQQKDYLSTLPKNLLEQVRFCPQSSPYLPSSPVLTIPQSDRSPNTFLPATSSPSLAPTKPSANSLPPLLARRCGRPRGSASGCPTSRSMRRRTRTTRSWCTGRSAWCVLLFFSSSPSSLTRSFTDYRSAARERLGCPTASSASVSASRARATSPTVPFPALFISLCSLVWSQTRQARPHRRRHPPRR